MVALVESGREVVQETRLWNDGRGETAPMRSKEDAHDYRYFPEPDLRPLAVSPEWLAEVRASLPELPAAPQIGVPKLPPPPKIGVPKLPKLGLGVGIPGTPIGIGF